MTESQSQPRTDHWLNSSNNSSIFYSPRTLLRRGTPTVAAFPTPHIRPRPRRPHSIHIISYPTGYVPFDLRPNASDKTEARKKKKKKNSKWNKKLKAEKKKVARLEESKRKKEEKEAEKNNSLSRDRSSKSFLGKVLSIIYSKPRQEPSSTNSTRPQSRISVAGSLVRRFSACIDEIIHEDPAMMQASVPVNPVRFHTASTYNVSQRNSVLSTASTKASIACSVTELSKPVASGSGLTCSIVLAEPTVFLSGFDHDGHSHQQAPDGTALLRGKLQLNVSKNVKIKAVQLKLVGKARTEWPEGIPPQKTELFEEEYLRTQVLAFFNAMHDGWESEYGNQCSYTLKTGSSNSSSTNLATPSTLPQGGQGSTFSLLLPPSRNSLTARELKRLSLQSVQSRSFGKGENPMASTPQAKGYKVFYPGTYEYSFELPIDHHQLETTKLQYGSVKWELHATVERAGAFKPNLHGVKEVSVVRVPDQLSLEMSEPISISRQWEDQLHYDIIISGKSFPIGTKIPIAFKLTPLAKVQVHKLKVFVTESVEYWTNDRKVTRKDPGRKILLLEKTAGRPLDPVYSNSDLRVVSGGELTPEQRREAREAAARRRQVEATRHHTNPPPLPEPTDNLLGDLDLGLETYWGSTEIEMNVHLPTCETMAKHKELRLNPDSSWKNVNVYHWIKVCMHLASFLYTCFQAT
jgi:arrestin-related trafficking adapter 3/6